MKKYLSTISAILLITSMIGTAFGVYFYIDSKYAYAEALKKLEDRVTINELKTLLFDAMKDYYFYKDLVKKYPKDKDVIQKLKDSEDTIKSIKDQIKLLETPDKSKKI